MSTLVISTRARAANYKRIHRVGKGLIAGQSREETARKKKRGGIGGRSLWKLIVGNLRAGSRELKYSPIESFRRKVE